jgi:hypothetical protein
MANVFYQSCPACGRPLQIDVLCFGELVRCSHCGKLFTATGVEPVAKSSVSQSLRTHRPRVRMVQNFVPLPNGYDWPRLIQRNFWN